MKKYTLLLSILALSLLWISCSKEENDPTNGTPPNNGSQGIVPNGYFVVDFAPSATAEGRTKAAIGQDGRVQYLRYIIYKSTGEYVKEKLVWQPSQGTATWPMQNVKDTLPKGSYNAIFLGNAEKSLFNNGTGVYTDVLTNYKSNYSDARIVLPNAEFASNTEYYWAKASFDNTTPNPTILLQRIVGASVVHRNFVDAQKALDTLMYNIVTANGLHNIIQNNVQSQLNSQLGTGLLSVTLGTILALTGTALNQVITALVQPVTETLYNMLLQDITNQIGQALTGNANQAGALAGLGALLNPWNDNNVVAAIVTINNFPKTIDFDLNVIDKFPNGTRFRYNFTNTGIYAEKDINVKGLGNAAGAQWTIQKINVIRAGLVSGVVIDGIVDTWLLSGTFIDINDPLAITIPANKRYADDYSFLDLKTSPTATNRSVNLGVQLGNIANLNGALSNLGLVGSVVTSLLNAIGGVTVSINGLQVPIVNNTNLILTGSWDTPTPF